MNKVPVLSSLRVAWPLRGGALVLAALMLGSAMGSQAASGPADDAPVGDHIVLHFRVAHGSLTPTVVVAIEDAAGNLVMDAFIRGVALFAVDGPAAQSAPAFEVAEDATQDWHRLDIVLHGATYTIQLDQQQTATLQTLTQADRGRVRADTSGIFPDADGSPIDFSRIRIDNSGGVNEHTFMTSVPGNGWQTVGNGFEAVTDRVGHESYGYLVMRPEILGTTYLYTSLDGFGGTYSAEVSAHPQNTLRPPIDAAVLAGLSGPLDEPSISWSIVLGKHVPSINEWSFTYVAPDGSRTLVGGPWDTAMFHVVHAAVDESAGSITITVDDGTPLLFAHETAHPSTRLAVGDINAGPLQGHGGAVYDDLALYHAAAPNHPSSP